MANFSGLQDRMEELIRKSIGGSAFVAPITAAAITTIVSIDGSAAATLPAGYEDFGLLTSDGVGFSQAVQTADTTSWGSQLPTRQDVTGKTVTFTLTAQETKRQTIEMETGVDLSAELPASGAVVFDMPELPVGKYYRVLVIAKDDTDDGEILIGRFFPRAKLASVGDQAFNGSEIVYPFNFQAFKDSTLGTSERRLYGGLGWKALGETMGFDVAS